MTQTQIFPHRSNVASPGAGRQTPKGANPAKASQPGSSAEQRNQFRQTAPAEKPYPASANQPVDATPGAALKPQASEQVRLLGRIGRYFEVKETRSGLPLATFSMATNHFDQDEEGNRLKKTVWHRIVVWGEAALALAEQLRKGARVSVEGRLKTREWFDRDNNLHVTTELVAREVRFLDMVQTGFSLSAAA